MMYTAPRHTCSGFTLVELSMSIGIGMLVAIAAFAAVDAASKTIAHSKQAAMEVDMINSAIKCIRNLSSGSSTLTSLSSERKYHVDFLGVPDSDWPAHWPILKIQQEAAYSGAVNIVAGDLRAVYRFTLESRDSVTGAQYLIPITSLP